MAPLPKFPTNRSLLKRQSCRRLNNRPRGIHLNNVGESPDQVALSVIDVNVTVARSGHVIMLGSVLFCIGYDQIASDELNVKGGKAAGDG